VSCKLYIIGSGGHAKVIAAVASKQGFSPVLIVRDVGFSEFYATVFEEDFFKSPPVGLDWRLICGVGSVAAMSSRGEILQKFHRYSGRFISIVSESAIVDQTAVVDPGAFVGPGAIVACNARIGLHSIVNSGAIIEHGVNIGSNTHVASGAVILGEAVISSNVLIGAGSTVLQGISIGSNSVVGAGSLCLKSISDDAGTWAGVPAKKMR
jgi:sugar O-acyltransferase (sialic acid O-acetyltransferase NeuD family)